MLYGLPVIQVRLQATFPDTHQILTIEMDSSLHILCQRGLIATPEILEVYKAIKSEGDFEVPFLETDNLRFYISSIVRHKGKHFFKVDYQGYSRHSSYVQMNANTFMIFNKMLEIHLGELVNEKV